jgi:hypothetical protein
MPKRSKARSRSYWLSESSTHIHDRSLIIMKFDED